MGEASLLSLQGSPAPGQAETLLAHGATPTRGSQEGCCGLKLPLAPKVHSGTMDMCDLGGLLVSFRIWFVQPRASEHPVWG